jgi:hypothetical protein
MAITGISIRISDPDLLKAYSKYIKASKSDKIRYVNLFEKIAARTMGASAKGSAGGTTEPDYLFTEDSFARKGLSKLLDKEIDTIEGKFLYKEAGSTSDIKVGTITANRAGVRESITANIKEAQRAQSIVPALASQDSTSFKNQKSKLRSNLRSSTFDLIKNVNVRRTLNAKNGALLFKIMEETGLKKESYNKSHNIQLVNKIGIPTPGIRVLTLSFPFSDFKPDPFKFELTKAGGIKTSIINKVEKRIIASINKSQEETVFASIKEFEKGLIAIGKRGNNFSSKNIVNLRNLSISTVVPHDNSIPMSIGVVKFKNTKKDQTLRRRAGQRKRVSSTRVVTAAQLSAVLRFRMSKLPGFGPIGGPAAPDILTHRTGRYLDSLTISSYNLKTKQINYWYNPIYTAHEFNGTGREPSKTLEPLIRNLAIEFLQVALEPVRNN